MINLDLIKFHSFSYAKKIHNMTISSKTKESWEEEKEYLVNSIKELKIHKKPIIHLYGKYWHFHKLPDQQRTLLLNILEKCHKTLYSELEQKFLEKEPKLFFYQIRIKSEGRLILFFYEDIFYPLLFDFNHIIFPSDKHGMNSVTKSSSWDYKKSQDKIKKDILKEIE